MPNSISQPPASRVERSAPRPSCDKQQHRTQNGEHDAQRDLRGDDVAGRPFRHLECVRRLRREDEHGDERRDKGEVVEGKQREGAPCAWLAGYEREDGNIDLTRAERVEKRHEERAAKAREGDSRTAPALHRNLTYQHLHPFRQLQCHYGKDRHLPELQRVAEAEEGQHEKRERENDHNDVVENAQTFKNLQGLHESEAHKHVGDERADAEREASDDARAALAASDGEDAGKRNHDREGARIESVDDSGEEDGRKRPSRRGGGGLRLYGGACNGNVDYRTFGVVAENLDVFRELARKHGLKRDRERRGGRRLDTH